MTTSDPISTDHSSIYPITENMSTAVFIMDAQMTPVGESRTFRFEDYTQRLIIASIISFISFFGLIGNTMVILAVVLSKRLHTRTNVFVVNLAVSDLIICLTSVSSVVSLVSKGGWPLPEFVCSAVAAIYFMCIACSIITLTAIAINRFILITKPIRTFQTIYTPTKIAVMLVVIWLYPILFCSLPFVGFGKWGYSEKYKVCSQDETHETSDYFSLVGSLMFYPIPLFILFVCYFKIYRHITSHLKTMKRRATTTRIELTESSSGPATSVGSDSTQQLQRAGTVSSAENTLNKRQVEITKNLFLVVCAFIGCLAPFAIALVIPSSDPVRPWTGLIVILNSMVNPMIYGFKHPHFKEVFRHMLRCQYHMIAEPSFVLRRMRSQ